MRPIFQRWADEKLINAYETHGKKDPRWDVPARKLIRAKMPVWTDEADAMFFQDFGRLAKSCIDAGCDDPLVLYLHADNDPGSNQRAVMLRRAVDALSASGYSPALLYLAQVELWDQVARDGKDEKLAGELVKTAVGTLQRALKERELTDEDHVIWRFLLTCGASDSLLKKHSDEVFAAVEAVPKIADWFKEGLRGRAHVGMAWQARGSGWAHTVSAQGWSGFQMHLQKARDHLKKSWELNPAHPAAAADMIAVTMGMSERPEVELRTWFDRTIAARMDFRPAYRSMLWALRPRWHGSHQEMLAFGRESAATKRFDSWAPLQLLHAVREIASEMDEPNAYWAESAPYPDLKNVFEGYLANSSEIGSEKYFRSHWAIIAVKCNQLADCRAQLEALKFDLHRQAAGLWALPAKLWVQEHSARSGPAAKLLRAAEGAAGRGEFPVAIETLEEALSTPDLDAPGRAYLEERLRGIRHQQRVAAAPARSFVPPANFEGWERFPGAEATVRDRSVLELRVADRPVFLMSETEPAGEFELTGEIELQKSEDKESEARIVIGRPDPNGSGEWSCVRFFRGGESGRTLSFYNVHHGTVVTKNLALGARSRFTVILTGGRVKVRLGDREVIDENLGIAGQAAVKARLGVGAAATRSAVVRFHNLQLRSAVPAPSTPAAPTR